MFRKSREREENFETLWWIINETKKRMLKSIANAITVWSSDNQNKSTATVGKKRDLSYAGLEIFIYLFYRLWKLTREYQDKEVGQSLCDYLERKICEKAKLEDVYFREIKSLRLAEYEGTLTGASNRTDLLSKSGSNGNHDRDLALDNFLENLAYAISREDCFSLYSTERTVAVLDSHILFLLHLTYKKVILAMDNAFIFFVGNILKANPDVTKLSLEELHCIEDDTFRDLAPQSSSELLIE